MIKNYHENFLIGGKVLPLLSAKYVSEKFKEKHGKDWVTGKDRLELLLSQYTSEARWHKAIQHFREEGVLTTSPKDIGPLMKEINQDLEVEEKENIKEELWKLFKKDLLRRATKGFPKWYKQKLIEEI